MTNEETMRLRDAGSEALSVLDHGYVALIEHWGSDERVIEAARMSTGRGFLGWGGAPCPNCDAAGRLSPNDHLFKTYAQTEEAMQLCSCKGSGKTTGDEKLLAYLWKNAHHTPFEMAGMVIEVQAPIMVFREWHRHRTQSFNELSARYTPLPDMNYVPTVKRLMLNSKTNKQAGTVTGSAELTTDEAENFRDNIRECYDEAEKTYQHALRVGVPKELARVHLPVGRYSRMRASANLRNWLAFLTLRTAPAAQWEIRQYANHVAEFVADKFPRTSKLWEESQ